MVRQPFVGGWHGAFDARAAGHGAIAGEVRPRTVLLHDRRDDDVVEEASFIPEVLAAPELRDEPLEGRR